MINKVEFYFRDYWKCCTSNVWVFFRVKYKHTCLIYVWCIVDRLLSRCAQEFVQELQKIHFTASKLEKYIFFKVLIILRSFVITYFILTYWFSQKCKQILLLLEKHRYRESFFYFVFWNLESKCIRKVRKLNEKASVHIACGLTFSPQM